MSVKVMGFVWDLELQSNLKLVLLAYADHADHDGGSIYPAVGTVARKTGYSEREVQRLTRELETSGRLVSDGSGPSGTRRWRIPLIAGGDKLTPPSMAGDVAVSPGVREGVSPVSPGGGLGVTGGVTQVSPEPSFNPSNNQGLEKRTDMVRCEICGFWISRGALGMRCEGAHFVRASGGKVGIGS
jgi:hypothetical protein